jgi:hypothetical protein
MKDWIYGKPLTDWMDKKYEKLHGKSVYCVPQLSGVDQSQETKLTRNFSPRGLLSY